MQRKWLGRFVQNASSAFHSATQASRTMVKVQPLDVQIDPKKCMGDWYVQVASPTPLDKNQRNGLEQYTWDEKKQQVCEHAQTHLSLSPFPSG